MDNLLKQYELGYLDDDYFQRGVVGTANAFWIPISEKFDSHLPSGLIQRLATYAEDV